MKKFVKFYFSYGIVLFFYCVLGRKCLSRKRTALVRGTRWFIVIECYKIPPIDYILSVKNTISHKNMKKGGQFFY